MCGLAGFVKLLNYLLESHRAPTLMAMSGFMLGSLRALWPFGEGQDAGIGSIVLAMAAGIAIVGAFILIDRRMAKN